MSVFAQVLESVAKTPIINLLPPFLSYSLLLNQLDCRISL